VLPILMQYQPYVTIVSQEGDINLIKKYREILNESLVRLE